MLKKLILAYIITFFQVTLTQIPIAPSATLNICDRKYLLEMQKTLLYFRNRVNAQRSNLMREYMLMVKQHTDLTIKIAQFEANFFDTATTIDLRRPYELYNRCRFATP